MILSQKVLSSLVLIVKNVQELANCLDNPFFQFKISFVRTHRHADKELTYRAFTTVVPKRVR